MAYKSRFTEEQEAQFIRDLADFEPMFNIGARHGLSKEAVINFIMFRRIECNLDNIEEQLEELVDGPSY